MLNIYEKLKFPANDKTTAISRQEGELIYDFLKKNKIKKTLEVGFAYGCSAAYIISATKSKHIAIDPKPDHYGNLGRRNMKELGLQKYLDLKEGYAHDVLPNLLENELELDFAFIDGGHKFDEIFIDFYYIDLLLKQGGYVLFHDGWLRSTQHVISWVKNNKKNYEKFNTPIKNLALFQKRGEDMRKWNDFKRFGTCKSLISQGIYKLKSIRLHEKTCQT
jgi:predicted O-methyltransferase YrrM